LQEGDCLENERDGQHDVPDDEVAARFRRDDFLDAARDGHCGAGHEQPERGEQRPDVGFAAMTERVREVGGRRDRRLAISRKTSLPASAQECAASARSDADPVTTAATDFAAATSTLTPKATRTVVTLSEPPGRSGPDADLSRS
ncbi:MAG: hypothetical protein QOG05_2524, partial [Streptosporangiaceae bacterium]|nr:hypothetical protein [Streptosporangiaceae bacterium]